MKNSVWRYVMSGAVGAVALWGGGCAVDPAADEPAEIGSGASAIDGGRVRYDHEEIGQLWMKFDGEWSYCTATLVDRRIAITAGHCLKFRNQDRPGSYGYLEIFKKGSLGIVTHRYTVDGYHNFDGWPHLPGFDPDDIGLVRLARPVPCSVARPAGLRKNPPPFGTVVSRWGFGMCGNQAPLKRMRHFARGLPTFMICGGDSGGPTMDSHGEVYQINAGELRGVNKDTVSRVEKEWNGITRVMNEWGRAGRCR